MEHQFPPTHKEIAVALGMKSRGGVKNIISALALAGVVVIAKGRSRGVFPFVVLHDIKVKNTAAGIHKDESFEDMAWRLCCERENNATQRP